MLSDERVMWQRFRNRKEWTFFSVLPKADGPLAVTWWCILLLRGILPALFAISMGVLVAAVQHGASLAGPLTSTGIVFVLLQVLTPIHQAVGANLGDRTAAWLYDVLTEACVRPAGMGHLEDPTLTSELTVAREFDLGMTGPPRRRRCRTSSREGWRVRRWVGSAIVLFGFAGGRLSFWSVARGPGDALLAARELGVDDLAAPTRSRCATPRRLRVSPCGGTAGSKELRLFGLADVDDRAVHRPSHAGWPTADQSATRLRRGTAASGAAFVLGGSNAVMFAALAQRRHHRARSR